MLLCLSEIQTCHISTLYLYLNDVKTTYNILDLKCLLINLLQVYMSILMVFFLFNAAKNIIVARLQKWTPYAFVSWPPIPKDLKMLF